MRDRLEPISILRPWQPRGRTFFVAAVAFCGCFASDLAFGQVLDPIPGEDRFQAITDASQENHGRAEIGFSQIDEDYFVTVVPRLDLNLGLIGLGLQVPLNLRVVDNEPKNDDDFGGVIRREDWDEPSEYLKVIRYVRYGHKGDFLYVRVGELAAEIGHGTIMSRYLNNFDVDTFRVGLQLDVNTDYGGVETVIADVGSLFVDTAEDSKLVGGRAYIKPLAWVDPESVFNIFQLGVTVISDTNAPYEIASDETTGDLLVDPDGNYQLADTRPATVYGFDIAVELLRSSLLDITPYTDLNFIYQAGWGWHLGVQALAKVPIGIDLVIPARLEYRRFREDYVPAYFSTFYELERFSFPLGSPVTPIGTKSRVLRSADDADGLDGVYGDLGFGLAGLVLVGAIYEDYEGRDPNFAAFVSVPALQWLQLKAYYARTGIKNTRDIFRLDDRSLAVGELRYEVVPFTFLVGRWTRRWVLNAEADPIRYESTDAWNVGLEFAFVF